MSGHSPRVSRTALAAIVVVLIAAGAWGRGWGRETAPELPRAGLTGPVGPRDVPCRGVEIAVRDDVQAIIDRHPAGTTFCLSAGVHRVERPVVPRRGDSLIGRPGAVLSGSKELTSWRANGGVWSAGAFLPAVPGDSGQCRPSEPLCTHAQDVFIDGRRLRPVGSPADVVAGTVFADYGSNTVTVADDPRNRRVEQAVAPSIIRALVDDVTVSNLVIEHAANAAQIAAVESRQVSPHRAGAGWQITNNEIRFNHGVGVGFADRTLLSGNHIHQQGQLGMGAWGADSVVTGNELAYNGIAGYSPEWEAGAGKSWMTTNQTLSHNYVHHNLGPGLWSDGGAIGTTYEYNVVSGNWGAGIQHEISYDAVIRHNVIAGNGVRHKGWAWDAGIQIQSSGGRHGIEITGNELTGNANGVALIDSGHRQDDQPAPHGPHAVRNVWVHDNTITLLPGQTTGAVQDTGRSDIFEAGNRFERNVYRLRSADQRSFSWHGEDITWVQWRSFGNGNDLNGRVELLDAQGWES